MTWHRSPESPTDTWKRVAVQAYAHLSGLHANIQVMRHPNKVIGGSKALLWSHHEKARPAPTTTPTSLPLFHACL